MSYNEKLSLARQNYAWFWRCFLSLLLMGVLLGVNVRTKLFKPLSDPLYDHVYAPLASVIQSPLRLGARLVNNLSHEQGQADKIDKILKENEELRAQVLVLGHYQAENRRLRLLMDSVGSVYEPVLIAELLDVNNEGYRESVVINKGAAEGVYEHQAVIDPFGLVGQVVEVFPHQSRVMLISDARSRVPVYVERTQRRGLVQGTQNTATLTLADFSVGEDVVVGDRLITSGLGGVYPRGYPVAEVVKVNRNPTTDTLHLELKPFAHLDMMLEVLLLDQRQGDVAVPVGPEYLSQEVAKTPPAKNERTEEAAQ